MASQNESMMSSKDNNNCFQPILSVFRIYGISISRSPRARGHRWVSFARALMLYAYTSGSVFVASILGYSLIHNMHDISKICLWAAFQSLLLTSFIFYVTSLRHQPTIADFFASLEQVLAMSSDVEAKTKNDLRFVRRLCFWITSVGLASQLLQACFSGVQTYFGRFHVLVSDTFFNLIGYPIRASDFRIYWVFVSTIYDFLASTFMQLYSGTVIAICLALDVCLGNLKQTEDKSFQEYHRKHQEICQLIRQTDSLFSLFLFVTLIRDVVIVVLLSRMLKSTLDVWDAMQVATIMAQSLVSLCAHTYCASRVNEKVYTSLDSPPSIGRSDGQTNETNEDCISHLVYIARLSSNKVGLTMWGFFVIGKGLIFTTIGTMVTYIIVLWQFG